MTRDSLPVVAASRSKWNAWLAKQHATSSGVWLEIAKKGSGVDSVSYAEALEVALCYGWIDGQKAAADEHRWLQRFTPRQPRSRWSKINCRKATELLERGDMTPAGLRETRRARVEKFVAMLAEHRTLHPRVGSRLAAGARPNGSEASHARNASS